MSAMLLVIGYWLLVIGYWLLVIGYLLIGEHPAELGKTVTPAPYRSTG
jgi:hypothetical protein